MRRSNIGLSEVADWHNLAAAFYRAAKGARNRAAAESFRANLDKNLAELRTEILSGEIRLGKMVSFTIRDPKTRLIHAPDFRERVLHHALMAHVGPILDRSLVDDTYACRKGLGVLAAVRRCRHHLQRFPYFVQIDIRSYFASIDHDVLFLQLCRKFKNEGLLSLFRKLIGAFETAPGKGLPIGALTSQHFANFYLSRMDRWLLMKPPVRALVRYMDDLVWWTDDRNGAREKLDEARAFAKQELLLTIKNPPHLGRSRDGLVFCGYRILPGALLLSRRKRKRYTERRRYWEKRYLKGEIGASALQRNFASVFGMTCHADANTWRREQLKKHPLEGSLNDL